MKENKFKQVIINDDEYYYSLLRKNVKEIRNSKGLTQQDLADLTYLSREYICDIENENIHFFLGTPDIPVNPKTKKDIGYCKIRIYKNGNEYKVYNIDIDSTCPSEYKKEVK